MAKVDRKWLPPVLIALATAASLIVYRTLPPLVDVRFDSLWPAGARAAAQPIARAAAAFGIPALALVTWAAFRIFRSAFGQRLGRMLYREAPSAVTTTEQFDRFGTTYETIVLAVVILLVGLHAAVLSSALQHAALAARIVGISFGVSLILMGNVMPRLRPNWVAGLRTKRTLENPQLWRATHRAFGTALVVSGLLTLVVAVALPRYGFVIGLGALVVSCLVGAIVSNSRFVGHSGDRELHPRS